MVTKNRSKSSKFWIKKNDKDQYVIQAKRRKFRSRSWFKLQEIEKKNKIFKSNMNVIDIGSSPGGWSQYAIKRIKPKGIIIACDILPMKPIKNVIFFKGNFCQKDIFNNFLNICKKRKIQVCMSDLSPNITGISSIDIPKSFMLASYALKICLSTLEPNGIFLIKIFQGDGFNNFLKKINFLFKSVKICKPSASRSRSREVYILAKEKNHKNIIQ